MIAVGMPGNCAKHKVIGILNHVHLTTRMAMPPLVDPLVEDIMQIDVGQ